MFDVTITFRGQVVAPLHTRFVVIVEWSGYVSVVDRVIKRLGGTNHAAKFEERQLEALTNGIANLGAPASITVRRQAVVVFGTGR